MGASSFQFNGYGGGGGGGYWAPYSVDPTMIENTNANGIIVEATTGGTLGEIEVSSTVVALGLTDGGANQALFALNIAGGYNTLSNTDGTNITTINEAVGSVVLSSNDGGTNTGQVKTTPTQIYISCTDGTNTGAVEALATSAQIAFSAGAFSTQVICTGTDIRLTYGDGSNLYELDVSASGFELTSSTGGSIKALIFFDGGSVYDMFNLAVVGGANLFKIGQSGQIGTNQVATVASTPIAAYTKYIEVYDANTNAALGRIPVL